MSLGCSSAISSSIYQKTAESTQPRPLCYFTGNRKRPTYLVNASCGGFEPIRKMNNQQLLLKSK